jgi:hypothetical protein
MDAIIGKSFRFDYPKEFVTLPEYTAHAGQLVRVTRQLTEREVDMDETLERMFEFVAPDGFVGQAFESELAPVE